MKTDLLELMKGKSLKSQIYNSISKNKLATVGKLLKHTLNPHLAHHSAPRYIDLKSEITELKTEYGSPVLKQTHSSKNFSKSVNQSQHDLQHKSSSRPKANPSKDHPRKQYIITSSKSKSRDKTRSVILKKSSEKVVKHISKSQLVSSLRPQEKRRKEKEQGQDKSWKGFEKTNLEQIVEQSSSEEQLLTPCHKKGSFVARNHSQRNNSQQTKKKDKSQRFSESFKRRLCRSFKQPETFQKLLKNDLLTIGYRILKGKLIEIEIYAIRAIATLKVTLEKGNLQCQSIQQQFKNVSANTVLSLFSSVRHLNSDEINDFPKIQLEAQSEQQQQLQRVLVLPYTWLHFLENKLPSLKRSRIKTKICLSELAINSTKLHVLSDVFHVWAKKIFKGHSQFETGFVFEEQEFSLKLFQQQNETFTLQLEGKGQQKLTSMISFLHDLIC